MDRREDLKRLLHPTRDDAVAAVYPPPGHPQSVDVYRSQMTSARGVGQSKAPSSAEIQERSSLETLAERGNEAIELPHAVQDRHDVRGIEQRSGPPGRKGHGQSELHFLPWSIPTAAVR